MLEQSGSLCLSLIMPLDVFYVYLLLYFLLSFTHEIMESDKKIKEKESRGWEESFGEERRNVILMLHEGEKEQRKRKRKEKEH